MIPSVLQQLSRLLGREAELLDLLVERLSADAEPAEYQGLLHSISSLELHRAIIAREVAAEFGLPGEPSLHELVQRAPREWRAILAAHRRELLTSTEEVRVLARDSVVATAGPNRIVVLPVGGRRLVQRSLLEFLY